MKIGAQLFTVREFTQTVSDFADTVKKIADIGFDCVQISAIGSNITPQAVVNICKTYNLEIVITHTNPTRIIEETAAVIEEHKIMGVKYIGIGSLPSIYGQSKEGYRKFISEYSMAAKAIKEAGLQFMYHNHQNEFEKFDGKTALDYMLEEFPDAGFTLDTYWVQAGGGDPAFWIRVMAGRVDVLHLKDYTIVAGERRMAEVMEGNMNWQAIFQAAKEAGVKYGLIEQDDCYGKDPFECLRTSLKNIKEWL